MPDDWQALRCACGSAEFLQVIQRRWKAGSGTSDSPVGLRCAACQAPADNAKLIRQAEVRRAERRLEEVQAELNQLR